MQYEVMGFTQAANRGMLKYFKDEDPNNECYIIYSHYSGREVYFGNKEGAYKIMEELTSTK